MSSSSSSRSSNADIICLKDIEKKMISTNTKTSIGLSTDDFTRYDNIVIYDNYMEPIRPSMNQDNVIVDLENNTVSGEFILKSVLLFEC